MKNFNVFLAVFIIIILSINACTYRQDNDFNSINENDEKVVLRENTFGDGCLENNIPPYINACELANMPLTIQIPAYNCQFYISINYYWCGENEIFVGDFIFLQPINCPQYYFDYNNAVNSNTLPGFELNFNIAIWQAITEKLLEYVAGSNFDKVTITYVKGSCTYTCYEIGVFSPNGIPIIKPVSYNCGENCCKIIRQFKNINGTFIFVDAIVDMPDEKCSSTVVDCDSPGSTICSGGCDELIGF